MALSRALKEAGGFRKNPGKSPDPLSKTSPAAKGKVTKQYDHDVKQKKYDGPNYMQSNSSGEKGTATALKGKMKLII